MKSIIMMVILASVAVLIFKAGKSWYLKPGLVNGEKATDTTLWIEGIGDVERLFWTSTFCSTANREDSIAAIRCYLMSDQVIYPNIQTDCYITAIDEVERREVYIFPNLATDVINLMVDQDQRFRYAVLTG